VAEVVAWVDVCALGWLVRNVSIGVYRCTGISDVYWKERCKFIIQFLHRWVVELFPLEVGLTPITAQIEQITGNPGSSPTRARFG